MPEPRTREIKISRRCPNCGLENIPERVTCKRCGAQLRPYTEEELGAFVETPAL